MMKRTILYFRQFVFIIMIIYATAVGKYSFPIVNLIQLYDKENS